jgi:hypothetical protein
VHTSRSILRFEQERERAEAAAFAKYSPPSFVSLHPGSLDGLNPPLSARTTALRMPPTVVRAAAASRSGFAMSDAALSRLIAPSASSARGASNAAVVDELAHVARTRLSTSDVILLRDKLTSILEASAGGSAAAITAVRTSRTFEAQLKQQKPVSVRDLCLAFPTWPSPVQCHFIKQIFRLGALPFVADDVHGAVPLPAPDCATPASTAAEPRVRRASGEAGEGAEQALDGGFDGLQGSMLMPLGLALPALRVPTKRNGPPAPPPPRSADTPAHAPDAAPAPSRQSRQSQRGSPRLAVMSRN